MTKGLYYKRKGISFTTCMTIYFTLIVFHDIFHQGTENPLSQTTIFFIGLYMFIGLASRDYRPIGMLVERVWSLNCAEGVDPNSKLQTIRAYLSINVSQWNKYWRLWQEIVEDKEGLWTWKQKLKEQILRIPKGSLSLVQFVWIVGYITYNVLEGNGYLPFLPPEFADDFRFLIDILGLGFFSYTSGIVIGLNKFMNKIFESIKPSSEREVTESLRLLEQHIIYGARHYGFLRDMIDIKCDLPPEYFEDNGKEIEVKP